MNDTKVYHEQNSLVKKSEPIWRAVNDLISSGRFKPYVSIEKYPYGEFVVEEFRIRVVRKTWQPGPGYSWSETIVYIGDEND